MDDLERDDLVDNFVTLISQANRGVQERMAWHFLLVKDELGLRVRDGLGSAPSTCATSSRASQTLTEAELERLSNPRQADPGTRTGSPDPLRTEQPGGGPAPNRGSPLWPRVRLHARRSSTLWIGLGELF
jgi:catalase-related immune-responsive protein